MKALLIIILIIVIIPLIFSSLLKLRVNQSVFIFPPIERLYHVCHKCNTYEGGIYGKGPTRRFSTDASLKCRHKWERLTIEDFAQQVADQYKVDWSQELSEMWSQLDQYQIKNNDHE